MRAWEGFLISITLGFVCFTVYLFASEPPAPAVLLQGSADPSWRPIDVHSIILHGFDACPSARTRRRFDPLPFHFVIHGGAQGRDGQIDAGRPWAKVDWTAHTRVEAWNRGTLAVAVTGDLDRDRPTPRQMEALVSLLARLCDEFHVDPDRILRHRDVEPGSACGGARLPMGDLRAKVEAMLKGAP